jgi:hypothetical protein
MVHMSMFSALAPINVSLFDERLATIVNFDLIPTENFFKRLGLSKPPLEEPEEDIEDSELEQDDEQGRDLRSKSKVKAKTNSIDFD